MQKNVLLIFWVLLSFTSKAQDTVLAQTVDSINAIIKASPFFYYIPGKPCGTFVKKISVTPDGLVCFKDNSIVAAAESTTCENSELLADCCIQKDEAALEIRTISKWEIDFPNAYLKNEKGLATVQISGLKKAEMEKLKERFEVLRSLCLEYVKRRELQKAKAVADQYRCAVPDPEKRAAAQAAMKRAAELRKTVKD